ncbi:hypothetical protein DPMN_128297 [Dreissena polymorpha]|uniref:Uncharacterized protein n=1 Tax=Dreissena polymorpha TaxID=45954 RepID=A0A9D4H2U5_DREPO|nr:hypothetical protein DPMN_128297 [Dreissena polymorpha]
MSVHTFLLHAPLPLCHVFQPTGTILKLMQDIIKTNVLTKFHEDWTMNESPYKKTASPPEKSFRENPTINVASRMLTKINALPPDIIIKNVLAKFHEDWTINVTLKFLTIIIRKPPGGPTDRPTYQQTDMCKAIYPLFFEGGHKNDPPSGGPDFQPIRPIFDFVHDIIKTNLLT